MFHEYLQGSLEALLFAAGEPLTVAQIAGKAAGVGAFNHA